MRVMRLGQHAMMHLPKGACGCRGAVAQRSAMVEMSERQAAHASETQAVTKREPHVTPQMAEVAADRAAIRSGRLMAVW